MYISGLSSSTLARLCSWLSDCNIEFCIVDKNISSDCNIVEIFDSHKILFYKWNSMTSTHTLAVYDSQFTLKNSDVYQVVIQ